MAKPNRNVDNINDPNNPWIDEATAPTTAKVIRPVEPKAKAKPKLAEGLDFSGNYIVSHGSVRVGTDTLGEGTVLELGTEDAVRALIAATMRPHDAETRAKISSDEHREALIAFAAHMLTPQGLDAFKDRLKKVA